MGCNDGDVAGEDFTCDHWAYAAVALDFLPADEDTVCKRLASTPIVCNKSVIYLTFK